MRSLQLKFTLLVVGLLVVACVAGRLLLSRRAARPEAERMRDRRVTL